MKRYLHIILILIISISESGFPQSLNIKSKVAKPDSVKRLQSFEQKKINSADEIFVNITYAGLVKTTVIAYYYKNHFFLPIKEICDNLEIINKISDYRITGFLNSQSNSYKIYFNPNRVILSDTLKNFTFTDYIKSDFDFFFDPNFYKNIFGIDIKVDFSTLTASIQSKELMPIYHRIQREKSYNQFSKRKKKKSGTLLYPRDRKLLGGAIFDYNFGYKVGPGKGINSFYNFKLGGELLGGDAQASLNGNLDTEYKAYNNFNYLWRYVFEKNPYLRTITAGKISLDGIYSLNYSGIRISNDQVEPRRTYETHRVHERTHANWTVEIYISNQLIAVAKADATGDFYFDLPLSYGTTLLEMKFYGPGGEYYEQTRLYQTPYYILRPNEFRYFVNYGIADNIDKRIASVKGGYGITDWLTTELGYQYLQDDPTENVFYNSTTARLFGEYLFNFTIAPEVYYKYSADVLYFSQTSFGVEYTNYTNQGYMNPANLKDDFGANFFIPIRFQTAQLNFKGTYDYAYSDNVTLNDYSFGTSASFSGFNPSVTYNYITSNSGQSSSIRQYFDIGFSYFINHSFGLGNFLSGNLLTFRTYYNTENSQIENYTIGFATTLKQIARIQFSHSWNFSADISSFQIQLVMYLDDVQVNTNMAKDGFRLGGLGSLTYDQVANEIVPFNRPQVGRSTAAFRFYIDSNGNNLFDAGEQLIKGGNVRMGTSVITQEENGIIRTRELDPYTTYDVTVVVDGIKNPLLVPGVEHFSFVADPNTVKNIEIPFYIAGEIDGKVIRKVNKGSTAVGGIKIHLKNLDTDWKATVITFSDGTYYYFGLPPGKYIAYLDEEQLKIIGVKKKIAPIEFTIKTVENGDIFMNADFILE